MQDYVVFDIETTGFDKVNDKIIQIGAVKVRGGVVVDKYMQLIDPEISIPPFITELTGISNEMVEGQPYIEEVLPGFINFLEALPVVAHNMIFDYPYVMIKCMQCGLDVTLGGIRAGICTLELAKMTYKDHKHNLPLLVQLYVDTSDLDSQAHRADYDAEVTRRLYNILLKGREHNATYAIPHLLTKEIESGYKSIKAAEDKAKMAKMPTL